MTSLTRLLEIITRRPHRYNNAQAVREATEGLRQDVQNLSARLRPYIEADDPLKALMDDLHDQDNERNGNGNGR